MMMPLDDINCFHQHMFCLPSSCLQTHVLWSLKWVATSHITQTGADKAWDWWVTNAADLSDDNWQIIVVSNVGMKIMEKICKVRSRSGWFFEIRLLWEMISSYFSCRVLNVCYSKIYVLQKMWNISNQCKCNCLCIYICICYKVKPKLQRQQQNINNGDKWYRIFVKRQVAISQ